MWSKEYLELNKGNNKKILDFGCGIGTSLFEYAEKYPQHQFIGLNVSDKQVCIANTKHCNYLLIYLNIR